MDTQRAGPQGGMDKRYKLDCRESGMDCPFTATGSYDEVIAQGLTHGKQAHGMKGEDNKLRDEVIKFVHEEHRTEGGGTQQEARGDREIGNEEQQVGQRDQQNRGRGQGEGSRQLPS